MTPLFLLLAAQATAPAAPPDRDVPRPLRLGLAYLPKNGPTLRISAGLELALSDALSLELVPLEAMIWVTRERPEVSLDGSLALLVAF